MAGEKRFGTALFGLRKLM